MGILEILFGRRRSSVEKHLEELTVPMFQMMGESFSQATASFAKLLNEVEDAARKEGTENLPENYGDILLTKEPCDDRFKAVLATRRREGVTDGDIKSWWNQPDLARRMSLKMDEIPRGAMFISCMRQGKSPDQAGKEVFRFFARYGDPADTSLASREDRPLPIELRDRINSYLEQWRGKPEQLREELSHSSSLNAWIRNRLKLGSQIEQGTRTDQGTS
jgi:hypothetical protein